MEVLRGNDGSVTFTFNKQELKRVNSGQLNAEVDRLKWGDFAKYFISYAQRHDPTGEFSPPEDDEAPFGLIEDFDKNGITIGYTALRRPPIVSEPATLPPIHFPNVEIELPPAEIPAMRLPEDVLQAAFTEVG